MVSNHDHANVTTHLQRIMGKIVLDRLLKMHCVELKIVQVCTFYFNAFLVYLYPSKITKTGYIFLCKISENKINGGYSLIKINLISLSLYKNDKESKGA